jgi:prepilin-type N-terminal cleavage/methylation domain-containing protein
VSRQAATLEPAFGAGCNQQESGMIRKPTTKPAAISSCERAFTLIELLVVISIVALIIGITVPALAAARNLAKESATNSTINSLVSAVGQFEAAENRMPGYFSPEEMGHMENTNRGMSAMQNVLLDLVGGPVASNSGGLVGSDALVVGPSSDSEVEVDLNLLNLGEGGKNYFVPKPNAFGLVDGGVNNADHKKLPDVVDAWGMPILAWAENDLAAPMVDGSSVLNFAQIDSSAGLARYYWAQNSVYLSSSGLGTRRVSQISLPGSSDPSSLIGDGAATSTRLTAFLGSPNSALDADRGFDSILPRTGRGAIVFQSAGRDLVYLSDKDDGYKAVGGEFVFGRNLTPKGTVRAGQYPQKNGPDGSIDIVDGFDDIVSSSGN